MRISTRIGKLEAIAARTRKQRGVVSVCRYPLIAGKGCFSAFVDGRERTFPTEAEMLAYIGKRTIGLYVPQPLSDAEWQAEAARLR